MYYLWVDPNTHTQADIHNTVKLEILNSSVTYYLLKGLIRFVNWINCFAIGISDLRQLIQLINNSSIV